MKNFLYKSATVLGLLFPLILASVLWYDNLAVLGTFTYFAYLLTGIAYEIRYNTKVQEVSIYNSMMAGEGCCKNDN